MWRISLAWAISRTKYNCPDSSDEMDGRTYGPTHAFLTPPSLSHFAHHAFFCPSLNFSQHLATKRPLMLNLAAEEEEEEGSEGLMATLVDVRGKRALLAIPSTGIEEDAEKEESEKSLGLNVARSLIAHGCRVVLVGDSSSLQTASLQIPCEEDDIHVLHLDLLTSILSIQSRVEDVVEKAWHVFGGFELFVTFSSFTGASTPFLETNVQQLETAMSVNFRSACLFSIAIGKRMREAGIGGSIIFVTSILGTERGLFPGTAVSGASIAAVNYLTRAMAMELGKYKIRVNAIARGLVDSDTLLKPLDNDLLRKEGERIVPLRRWGDKTRDLTSMILYLGGDMSSFMTGTVIFVDGGQSLVRSRMKSFL